MIDTNKIKSFWQTRGDKFGKLPFESIANLEEKPELLALKIKLEQEKVMPRLSLTKKTSVLDLGAGVGQWAFRFAPFVQSVTAVEYIKELVEIGCLEAQKRNLNNVRFISCACEEFNAQEQFDLIFISGLFVYLDINQVQKLMKNLPGLLRPRGTIFVRDGTSVLPHTHYIDNNYSEILQEYYSAIYRTRKEYLSLFNDAGFQLIEDDQMFEESCPLNKFSETRLRFYIIKHRENQLC